VTALLVALGAAVGAPLRFATAHYLDDRVPRGTLAVNVLGSTLLGLLSALSLSGSAAAVLATGFCGGFTTYSAFAVQTHGLGRAAGTAYAVATLGLCLLGAAAGWALGSQA
jgi:fluoride exporter